MAVKSLIKYEVERDPVFAKWVTGVMGGERIRNCIQCGLCSASCPLSPYMDLTPRRLIHMAREGFKRDVLESFTIWLCTSCYSCTVECPRRIRVTDVMYALKRRAIEDGVYPRRFPIPVLASEFGEHDPEEWPRDGVVAGGEGLLENRNYEVVGDVEARNQTLPHRTHGDCACNH